MFNVVKHLIEIITILLFKTYKFKKNIFYKTDEIVNVVNFIKKNNF